MYTIKNWYSRTNNHLRQETPHKGTCCYCNVTDTLVLDSKFTMPVEPLPKEQTRNGMAPITDDMPDPRTLRPVTNSGDYCNPCHDVLREYEVEYKIACMKYRDVIDNGEYICY